MSDEDREHTSTTVDLQLKAFNPYEVSHADSNCRNPFTGTAYRGYGDSGYRDGSLTS
ncbi:hypothetical protein [Alicyclobacillus dauci]|uniref:Uncharacterized protein n=1 Tax=Alicyclobacillus dauci TaxID=1475485 RepID=A0ABY6YZM9_9BACL|nr:hypothetical protein [Alicyclobacillus dauci]WAH36079.1 hypothetical protein NZD86_17750 [Alicyclobacillus dauci]